MKAKVAGFIALILALAFLSACGFFTSEDNNGGGSGGGTTTAKFAYVTNLQNGSVAGLNVSSNGTLSAVTGSPFSGGPTQPSAVAVTPDGAFVFVADQAQQAVFSFPIDRNTGALTGGSPSATPNLQPIDVAVTPNGSFVYVLDKGVATGTTINGDVQPYTIGTGGVLVPITGTNQAVGLNPWTVRIDPSSKFLYVAGDASGTWVFSIQTSAPAGTLLKVAQVATTTNTVSRDIAIDPNTRFAYVANGSTGVETYSIDTTGSLTRIGAVVPAQSTPIRLAITPNGKFLYVVNQGSNSVTGYSITNGTLTALGSIGTGTSPTSIAVDPDSSFVYVTNQSDSTVSVYSIGTDGSLTAIQTPINVGAGPSDIVLTK